MGMYGQSIIVPSSFSHLQLASTWILPGVCSLPHPASVWVLSTGYNLSRTDHAIEGPPTGFIPSWTVQKWILLPGCSLRELFQCGFSPWITVLQDYTALAWITGCRSWGKFLLYGILFAGCSSCQEPVPVWGLHRLYLPSVYIHLLWHRVLYGLNCGHIFQWGPQWAARGQPVYPWSSPQTAGESLLLHL